MFCPTCGEKSEKLIEYNGKKYARSVAALLSRLKRKIAQAKRWKKRSSTN